MFCAKIVNHKFFDPFILFIITITTLTLALDNPLDDPKGKIALILSDLDLAFTSLFAIEFVIKTITYGFIFNGKQSYMRNTWNIIDISILVLSVSILNKHYMCIYS